MINVLISILMLFVGALIGFTLCALLTISKESDNMRDYQGDFKVFEDMLKEAGVSEEEFNVYNLVGATYNEIYATVKVVIENHKREINKTV